MSARRLPTALSRGALAVSVALGLSAPGCGAGMGQPPLLPLASHKVPVEGARLHYLRGGSGPPLLLLHGFMGSAAAWERFAADLGRTYTLLIPDLPGHGQSTGLPDTWSVRRVAAQMLEFLDRVGVERARAIGCSAGADVLLHMTLQQPEQLDAMVLISASHRLTDAVRTGLRSLPVDDAPPEWRDWSVTHNPRGQEQVRSLLGLLRGLADNREDFDVPLDRVAAIPTRTLIATGDRDESPSLDTTRELHRALRNSSLWVVPNAGHCPFWHEVPGGSREAERTFAAAMLNFLAEAGGG